jgi:hypothetical protein
VLNFWYRDIGTLDATRYVLLETELAEAVEAAGRRQRRWRDGGSSGAADGDRRGGGDDDDDGEPALRSALVFAVRDADDDVEHE